MDNKNKWIMNNPFSSRLVLRYFVFNCSKEEIEKFIYLFLDTVQFNNNNLDTLQMFMV